MPRLKTEPVLECRSAADWETWLANHHTSSKEVWLRLAKKGSAAQTVTRSEALEIALCYGWIDGQGATQDEVFWLQRFTPRSRRSKWSQINCELAENLIRSGRMKSSGLAAVEAARADGRWDAAYASPRRMKVPDDLIEKLKQNPAAGVGSTIWQFGQNVGGRGSERCL